MLNCLSEHVQYVSKTATGDINDEEYGSRF